MLKPWHVSSNYLIHGLGNGIPGGGICLSRGIVTELPERRVSGAVRAKGSNRSAGGGGRSEARRVFGLQPRRTLNVVCCRDLRC